MQYLNYNNMRKKLSLNTQLKALQLSINNLKQLPDTAIELESQDAKDAISDIKQIIYSLRDIRYKLTGIDYMPVRHTQMTKYPIKEIRDRLNIYTTRDYLNEHIKSVCREECARLVTVDEYLNRQPDKYIFAPAHFTEIVELYKKVIIENKLPTISLSMYKYICESLKESGYNVSDAQNFEPEQSSQNIQNDDLF